MNPDITATSDEFFDKEHNRWISASEAMDTVRRSTYQVTHISAVGFTAFDDQLARQFNRLAGSLTRFIRGAGLEFDRMSEAVLITAQNYREREDENAALAAEAGQEWDDD